MTKRYEVRATGTKTWQIYDTELGTYLNTVYWEREEADVACNALEDGKMATTRNDYTRDAWAKAQKSAPWSVVMQYKPHQETFPTPAEVAENIARAIHEQSVVDRLLGEAVPWLR